MTETREKMTADELLALPDSGKRHELVAGELIEMVPPGGEHGYVGGNAYYFIRTFLVQHKLGGAVFAAETGFRLHRNPDTVRAADAAYVAEPRVTQARATGYPDLAPDLVVEVVSPHDTASEIQAKVEDWLGVGTRLVWVIYPGTRSVVVYRPGGKAQVLHEKDILNAEPVLPGFECKVEEFFT